MTQLFVGQSPFRFGFLDLMHLIMNFFTARDLPAELILGVDVLKKAQIKINFQDSSISLPSGIGQTESKVSFLSSKELNKSSFQQDAPGMVPDYSGGRAYSSNF